MQFRVVGADMYTGKDVEIIVDAATREAANKKATRQSIVVLSIDPADEHIGTPSTASIFDGLRPTNGTGSGDGGASLADQHTARRTAATCQMNTGGRAGRRGRSVFVAVLAVVLLTALAAGVVMGRSGVEQQEWIDAVVGLAHDAIAWLSEVMKRVTG